MQIQVLLAEGAVVERIAGNRAASTEMARLQIFNGTLSKVSGFVTACRLYYKDKDEGGGGRRTDPIDLVICAERIGRYMEGEYTGRFRSRRSGIQVYRRIFSRNKEGVWRR